MASALFFLRSLLGVFLIGALIIFSGKIQNLISNIIPNFVFASAFSVFGVLIIVILAITIVQVGRLILVDHRGVVKTLKILIKPLLICLGVILAYLSLAAVAILGLWAIQRLLELLGTPL